MRQIMDKMKLSSAVWICIFTSSIFYTVYTQELAHFNETSSVDFKKDNLWAEIMPGEIQEHKAKGFKSGIDNGTTSAPIVRANEKNVKSQTSSWQRPTVARVGRVQLGAKTSESEADRTTQKLKVFDEVSSGDRGEDTPPLILNPLTTIPRQIIWSDSPVQYQCVAQGHPKPVFRWYWDDTPLGTSGNKVKSFLNGTLYLENFTEAYNGKYKCTATNKHGEDVSVTFEIVRGFQSKSVTKDEVPVVVKKWDKLNIACGETPVSIKATKRWYFTDETKQIFADERIGTDSEGTIHFAYTELRDSDIYFCGLVNTAGIKVYNPRRLVVQDASDTGDSGPLQEFITKNAKAIIDREFKMECFFSGKPAPKVTWKNNQNEEIPAGESSFYEVEDFGRKLKIKKVRQEDEGTYTCRAENTVDVTEATITVNVTSPPMRTKDSLRSYTKPDKEDFVFPCRAAAASGESVEPSIWYRNGEMLTRENLVNKSRYSFNEDFTELTIKQLVKQVDTASYQCRVTNSEGELYMNGYLRVINSLEITRQPGDKIKVSSNITEVFDITVLAKGDTCCAISIVYYFNGTQISEAALNTPPFRKNGRTGTVMFVPSSVSAEVLSDWMGEYRCDVSDRYQRKNILFSIVAKETTPEPYVATADSSGLWWIGILCGVLAIIIVIVVVFVIYKSNYPGDTYQLEKTELKHNLNPEEDLLNQSFQEI